MSGLANWVVGGSFFTGITGLVIAIAVLWREWLKRGPIKAEVADQMAKTKEFLEQAEDVRRDKFQQQVMERYDECESLCRSLRYEVDVMRNALYNHMEKTEERVVPLLSVEDQKIVRDINTETRTEMRRKLIGTVKGSEDNL